MKKTNKKFWLAALLTAAVLTGVSGCGEITTPSSSLTERSTETTAEQTQDRKQRPARRDGRDHRYKDNGCGDAAGTGKQ